MQSITSRGKRPRRGNGQGEALPSIGCYVKDEQMREYQVARPEESRRPPKRRRYKRLILSLFILLALSAGVLFGLRQHGSGDFDLIAEVKNLSGRVAGIIRFPIEEIHIVGHHHTAEKQIISSLGDIWDKSVISLNTFAAQKNIEKLPWVKRAVVERVFPHGLNIYVEERVAAGRWARPDGLFVFDKNGVVIEKLRAGAHRKLPIFEGGGAPEKAGELEAMLTHFKDLTPYISRFSRVENRRWTLIMDSGLEVHLPEAQVEMALARLRGLQEHHNILKRRIAVVDLRLPDRVTLRPQKAGNTKVSSITDAEADKENVARLIEGILDEESSQRRDSDKDGI